LSHFRLFRPTLSRAMALGHQCRPVSGNRFPAVSGPLAGRADTAGDQTVAGLAAAVCLCSRELPALAGISPVGGQHLDPPGCDVAAHAHRLLGPTPQKTAGRLRRVLARAAFPKEALIAEQFRKKWSVTDHLPKG